MSDEVVIKVVMIQAGVEIIGSVVRENAESITLEKTLVMNLQENSEQKGVSLQFLPFSVGTKEKTFQKNAVAFVAEPIDSMAKAYCHATGITRIVVPPKDILLG